MTDMIYGLMNALLHDCMMGARLARATLAAPGAPGNSQPMPQQTAARPSAQGRRAASRAAPAARQPKRGGGLTRYALLLRGVNVGTKNSLPMAELRAMLGAIGCSDVATYVQSGNAVFATSLGAAELTRAIEARLEAYMGRPIATTLRTGAQIDAVVAARPFDDVVGDLKYLCVTFLSETPRPAELAPLEGQRFAPERYLASGREIYTWHPAGQARSPLAVALAQLKLRGAVTTRNWNTVLKLQQLLSAG